MGLTYIKATVINPADPSKRLKVEFLVDSGAMYSVVPKTILKNLELNRVKPEPLPWPLARTLPARSAMPFSHWIILRGLRRSSSAKKATRLCSAWFRWKPLATSSIRCDGSCGRFRWCWDN